MSAMNPQMIATEIFAYISQLSGPAAYATIVSILLICGFGVPIPEDVTLLAAGLLAYEGRISLIGALIACFSGVIFGDACLFFLGRKFGKRIFKLPGLRRVFSPEHIASAEEKIRKNGPLICFAARFFPGLRAPIFAMAGTMGVRPIIFFALDGFAALISVPIWVNLGYWFGSNIGEALHKAKHIQGYIFSGLVTAAIAYAVWLYWKRRKTLPLQPKL
jgi:membrane protein DedA with SNARE-associated domain